MLSVTKGRERRCAPRVVDERGGDTRGGDTRHIAREDPDVSRGARRRVPLRAATLVVRDHFAESDELRDEERLTRAPPPSINQQEARTRNDP